MKNLLTLLLISIGYIAIGQNVTLNVNDKHYIELIITGIKTSDGDQCSDTLKICKGSKIQIESLADNDSVEISILKLSTKCNKNTDCTSFEGETYRVDKAKLQTAIVSSPLSLEIGVLAVPFKFDKSNFKLFPGGEVGFVIGPSYRTGARINGESVVLYVGLNVGGSSIPINTVDNANVTENTETVGAFTIGIVLGLKVSSVQFNFTRSTDRYNINSEKKKLKWYSVGVGVSISSLLGI